MVLPGPEQPGRHGSSGMCRVLAGSGRTLRRDVLMVLKGLLSGTQVTCRDPCGRDITGNGLGFARLVPSGLVWRSRVLGHK